MQEALHEQPGIKDLLVMSFIEQMERTGGEPASGMGSDLDALSRLYMLEALKNLSPQHSPDEGQARE
jgi:hypothetical protein